MVAMLPAPVTNEEVAAVLDDVAAVLAAQDANPFRVRAYADAARTIRALDRPVASVLETGGRAALEEIPGIGKSLAASIDEIAHSGRLPMLERLLGRSAPEDLFTLVPGIGEDLARRIHETLGVETLEDLEAAAHDGSLARVKGFGPRRLRAVREVLGGLLARSARRRARRVVRPAPERAAGSGEEAGRPAPAPGSPPAPAPAPAVDDVLAIDARYRDEARTGRLRRIAPRRFNPTHEAWLPVLHAERGGWRFTAMFSNTATAHRLGRTGDWVVLYFERDGDEGQCTVVTETRGPLAGRRVVRGREAECQDVLARGA
jgi:hypothetical protein